MKRFLIAAMAVSAMMLTPGLAFAADQENSGSTTVDHSHNPITGSDTTTKTTKHTRKHANGSKHKMKRKESTKKTNGTTEKKTTDEESNTPAD